MNLITIDKNECPSSRWSPPDRSKRPSELTATGTVFPDISREVPVISLANGRVVDIKARLDDNVKKGQLLFRVQSPDVTSAFDAYLKAVNDEQLANKAYHPRQGSVQARRHLAGHAGPGRRCGERRQGRSGRRRRAVASCWAWTRTTPASIVNVYAPISGVIIGQNVTNAAAAGVSLSGSATAFTIADLSSRLDRLRRLRERHSQTAARPGSADQAQCISRPPAHRPHQRHRPGARSLAPHRQGAHRGRRIPAFLKLGMFVTATFTSQQQADLTPWCQPMLCFICTTATGSMCPPAAISSGASRCTPATCSTAIARRFSPALRARPAGGHQRAAA